MNLPVQNSLFKLAAIQAPPRASQFLKAANANLPFALKAPTLVAPAALLQTAPQTDTPRAFSWTNVAAGAGVAAAVGLGFLAYKTFGRQVAGTLIDKILKPGIAAESSFFGKNKLASVIERISGGLVSDIKNLREAGHNFPISELEKDRKYLKSVMCLDGMPFGNTYLKKLPLFKLGEWKAVSEATQNVPEAAARRFGSLLMKDQTHYRNFLPGLSPLEKVGNFKGLQMLENYRDELRVGTATNTLPVKNAIDLFTYRDLKKLLIKQKAIESLQAKSSGYTADLGKAFTGFQEDLMAVSNYRLAGETPAFDFGLERARRAGKDSSLFPKRLNIGGSFTTEKFSKENLKSVHKIMSGKSTTDENIFNLGLAEGKAHTYLENEKRFQDLIVSDQSNNLNYKFKPEVYKSFEKSLSKEQISQLEKLKGQVLDTRFALRDAPSSAIPEKVMAPHRDAIAEFAKVYQIAMSPKTTNSALETVENAFIASELKSQVTSLIDGMNLGLKARITGLLKNPVQQNEKWMKEASDKMLEFSLPLLERKDLPTDLTQQIADIGMLSHGTEMLMGLGHTAKAMDSLNLAFKRLSDLDSTLSKM